jgi:hypothetical protein
MNGLPNRRGRLLPSFTATNSYAPWPVWTGSVRGPVKFAPLSKREAVKRWYAAKRFDLQTHQSGKHGGAVGRTALEVLRALLLDFLNFRNGRLDPSYAAIAAKAGVCRRAVATALQRLRALGILHWQRRCEEDRDEAGRYRLRQETNAYGVLPPSQWRGYWEPPPAPIPERGTWGDHPPLPDVIEQAVTETVYGQYRAARQALTDDPGNRLALALAALGAAVDAAEGR